jgi:purine-cytosine permease-like protein
MDICIVHAFIFLANNSLVSAQILIMWLGAAFMTCVPGNDDWQAAYDSAGAGGLMNQAFQGHGPHVNGFGKFVQFVLVLSTIAVTIPNLYSMGLSMQNVGMWAVKVPRFIWTTIGFVVFTVAAIAGREHFASILENFLNCLAYWYTSLRTYLIIGLFHGLRLCALRTGGSVAEEETLISSTFGGHKRDCRMESQLPLHLRARWCWL